MGKGPLTHTIYDMPITLLRLLLQRALTDRVRRLLRAVSVDLGDDARLLLRRADKREEQRVRAGRTALELWMELRRQEPRMIFQLDDLHQLVIGGAPTHQHALRLDTAAIGVIELIAVAVALEDDRLAVGCLGLAARRQAADPLAQPHCAALIRNLALIGHQIDHLIGRLRIELGAIRRIQAKHATRELDDRDLQSQAQPEVWDTMRPRVFDGFDLALDATVAEAARHDDACRLRQPLLVFLPLLIELLGIHPVNLYVYPLRPARVRQR